jgi:hypothetical protein
MKLTIGTVWQEAQGREPPHSLVLDLDDLRWYVSDDSRVETLEQYLARHPERMKVIRESIRLYFQNS